MGGKYRACGVEYKLHWVLWETPVKKKWKNKIKMGR